ncbi:Gfo/Idh/MocA family protein [Sneathiella sp. HT1-7]|uniref:Gfo/Idh/MocA family protein n=1 Tax=Sneathiella sp. HT1-7 TaxID=2887192 RepID=UPI001D1414AC|nr:Gfo/Idh/MocA family oxidoreductase [Sneathiella sp. HT1-7]MCC3305252.1 Gfo/Idh/MocA family oxidoreductase [Sneathiella sp. HT1-7]
MTFNKADKCIDAIGVGVVGLGRAFMLTRPDFEGDARFNLVAACDTRAEARDSFSTRYSAAAYSDVEKLAADPSVEAVYIASPHQLHEAHAITALTADKHVLIEKPIAIKLSASRAIIEAAAVSKGSVIVGPSHSFDPQIEACLDIVKSEEFGRLRMIRTSYYTDFMYRPRRPEEMRTEDGGGVVFSQAVHQVDIVRLLAGGLTKQVFSHTGDWDEKRPTEGAYTALLKFENGISANLHYSGYAHYDTDAAFSWMSELGMKKDPAQYGAARKLLRTVNGKSEGDLKNQRMFGSAVNFQDVSGNEHFGELTLTFDHADIRVTPQMLEIYGEDHIRSEPVLPVIGRRSNVLSALWGLVRENKAPVQDGRWGHATLEVCHGILSSGRSGEVQIMREQVPVPGYPATT